MQDSVKNMIEKCDFIGADTSALMDNNAFLEFLEHYQEELKKYGRCIFIYREVIAELKNLLNATDLEKKNRAEKALEMIYDHYDILKCEEEPDNIDERIIRKRIADQRILSAVTWYKTSHSQLFISNDKKLLESILKVDEQEAVKGRDVYAASLTCDGRLRRFEESDEYLEKWLENESVKNEKTRTKSYLAGHKKGMATGGLLGTLFGGGVVACFVRSLNRT